jgi:hypothetical protein
VVDSPTASLTAPTNSTLHTLAITPSTTGLCGIRMSNRNVGASTSATALTADANWSTQDGGSNYALAYLVNGTSGILLGAEIYSNIPASLQAASDLAITGFSDAGAAQSQRAIALTLQATGAAIASGSNGIQMLMGMGS